MAIVNSIIAVGTKEAYKFWREAFGLEPKEDEDEDAFMEILGQQMAKIMTSTIEGGDEAKRFFDFLNKKAKGEYAPMSSLLPAGETFIKAAGDVAQKSGSIARRSKELDDGYKIDSDGKKKRLTRKQRERMREQIAKDSAKLMTGIITLFGGLSNIPVPFMEQAFGSREAFEKAAREYYDVD